MASSRWKRFAFFDRHTLNVSNEVLEDILSSEISQSSRRTSNLVDRDASCSAFSLVVTTAALPFNSKPAPSQQEPQEGDDKNSVLGMWDSLMACTAPAMPLTEESSLRLPSQRNSDSLFQSVATSTPAMDGLILIFVSSQNTDIVHCFDVTVRCNPPESEKDLEDMDGWRGYFAPLAERPEDKSVHGATPSSSVAATTTVDTTSSGPENIVGMAVCRLASDHRPVHVACVSRRKLVVCEDPHLFLSCRLPLSSRRPSGATTYTLSPSWNTSQDGFAQVVDIAPGVVTVGTDNGTVLVFSYGGGKKSLRPYLTIPPPQNTGVDVTSVKIAPGRDKLSLFVAYGRKTASPRSALGICCYEMPSPGPSPLPLSAPSARHDLDGRNVASSSLCGSIDTKDGIHFVVARTDGLYTYSPTQKVAVSAIDGTKRAVCVVQPPVPKILGNGEVGSSYALVASMDAKAGRDTVDVYDTTNKLVAFHLLLSPGHSAVGVAGLVTSSRTTDSRLSVRRSSLIVLTSGGSIVTLTEKGTPEKVSLLVQKSLYSAAISMAYADPSFEPAEITGLYRRHAEHLYRMGDYGAAMEQYINTIGSLESSHVIFRYLDAPKIPYLVKYLEELKARDMATSVHNELLRTCFLKLNDTDAAEKIATSVATSADDKTSLSSLVSTLSQNPKEALAIICSYQAPQAAEAIVMHGPALVRVLPRETAGIVVSLCLGTYSSQALSDAATATTAEVNKLLEQVTDESKKACDPYPVQLFASAFLENPKMLRLILAHCNRNKCPLSPSLRRTLLELTLAEWNQAKRSGDTEAEKLRRKEAIAALTDSHCRDIGDYEALVIVQFASFEEGELLLYERLQMAPMLLARYAEDGSQKARRQMLAMGQSDPEILADVLGHFVRMASERIDDTKLETDEADSDDEDEILDDIRDALALARRQGVLPPVRIARILAGEGSGQFSTDEAKTDGGKSKKRTVPLSVALDYVGAILDDSRKDISRLKTEIEEYNQLCNSMEIEVEGLLKASVLSPSPEGPLSQVTPRINIEEMYTKLMLSMEDESTSASKAESKASQSREAFWREINQSEERFETIARFFAKGIIQ